ncbi:MAG: response regulator transcription factor [Lachnospiraceae bacterium]|jgi:DNA-binding NarL/FixJ family response regulator|nr:response regulator transcription factor [Lachnospiraceae bacterium]
MAKIKVLIAEDMEPIRRRYVKILNAAEGIEVCADVGTGREAVERQKDTDPDVILMDIEMETADAGLRATQQIFQNDKDVKIIILTVYEEDELIFTAFQLGVCDYILKNADPEEIINSVRCAYENRSPLRPEIASKILSEFKRVRSSESSFLFAVNIVTSLTSTELEILNLLIMHKSRAEICELRHVEMSTVKSQIHEILKKFNMNSAEEVVELIERMNLYDLIYSKVNHKT